MNTHEQNGNVRVDGEPVDGMNEYHEASPVSQTVAPLEPDVDGVRVDSEAPPAAVVTRKDLDTKFGIDKRKLPVRNSSEGAGPPGRDRDSRTVSRLRRLQLRERQRTLRRRWYGADLE